MRDGGSHDGRLIAAWLRGWLFALPLLWCPALSSFGLAKSVGLWMAAAGAVALTAFGARRRAGERWCALTGGTPALLILLAILAALPALVLRVNHPTGALDRLAADVSLLALVVTLARAAVGTGRWAGFADAALFGGAAAAALDLLAGLLGADIAALSARPPYGNAMLAAAHGAVLVPLAVHRLRCARGRRAALVFGAGALLLLDLGFTGSLGGLIAASIGAAAGWLVAAPEGLGRRAGALVALAAVAAVALLALSGPRASVERHLERRSYVWKTSAAAARQAPLLGHGAGEHGRAFYDTQAKRLAARPADAPLWTAGRHAHNTILERWVEDGAVAAALWALAFLWALVSALRRRSPALGPLAALGATALYAFPLASPATVALIALLLAERVPAVAADGASRTSLRRRFSSAPGRLAARGLAVVLALALFGWASVRAASDGLALAGRTEVALHINATDARVQFAAGVEAARRGAHADARTHFERSLALRPDLAAALMAGNAALGQGELDEAERHYRQALVWHPRHSLAAHNLAWVAVLRGDLPRAERLARQAVRRNPDNPALTGLVELLTGYTE